MSNHPAFWDQRHFAEHGSVENTFIRAVYGWMFAGLLLSALAALWTIASAPMRQLVLGTPGIFLALLVAELGLVFWLSAGVARMGPSTAAGVFLVYSLMNGLTLSGILLAYATATIVPAFMVAASMFGVMSLLGYIARRDLASLGGFLTMALVGIVIASVVNLFLRLDSVMFLISVFGVFVFAGLTAWDTQKMKTISAEAGNDARFAIVGALALYLDFLNLFLMLLQLFGGRRRNR